MKDESLRGAENPEYQLQNYIDEAISRYKVNRFFREITAPKDIINLTHKTRFLAMTCALLIL